VSLPDWLLAWPGLRLSLERRDERLEHALWSPVTPRLAAVLAWASPDEDRLTWLARDTPELWGHDLDAIAAQAARNLDRIVQSAALRVEELAGARVALWEGEDWLKASYLLAPNVRERVEPHLGWPVHAIAPCRDFVLLFSEPTPALLERLAGVVAHEWGESDDPLTAEVLRLDDEGFGAIGEFQEG
jgi:hypothetical protein